MIEVLFTKSELIGSKMIRDITKEDVSHCAIRYRNMVLHSSYWGVKLLSYEDFKKHNTIVHSVELPLSAWVFVDIWHKYKNKPYDYGAFFFLGLRYLCVKLHIPSPRVNLWQSSGSYLCSEFVSSAILGEQDSLITPYQLYLKLKG